MSNFERPVDRDDQVIEPVSALEDDDPPARRLLAHDLEHLVWDDDGEATAPPPD
jgi:hypothetical protein